MQQLTEAVVSNNIKVAGKLLRQSVGQDRGTSGTDAAIADGSEAVEGAAESKKTVFFLLKKWVRDPTRTV